MRPIEFPEECEGLKIALRALSCCCPNCLMLGSFPTHLNVSIIDNPDNLAILDLLIHRRNFYEDEIIL